MKAPHKHTNSLINESSPYLLQHAHNPVNWHAWNPETLELAKREDKMLLISIGYSACHWCHVMEHESFENEQIAKLMNENFVCIKVDREERPDVDAIYMNAVQLIHGNGGWPLNCFALPDGSPFYGGTYFQPQQWEVLLKNVSDLYHNRRNEVIDQAKQVLEGIHQDDLIKPDEGKSDLEKSILQSALDKWQHSFDLKFGGSKGAPKFPMPSNIDFLLEYGFNNQDESLQEYVKLTLDKMAMGGIYDQIGGGFSRYSVDAEWKVPHFEKMLYDNAQLISVYSNAYRLFGEIRFLQYAKETANFVLKELRAPEGIFYSALDADSEGEEGKFYVWSKQEFETCLGEKSKIIADFYQVDAESLWEDGKNVLSIKGQPEAFARDLGMDESVFLNELSAAKQLLLSKRKTRIRPGLDDKSLTSWNALMIKALVELSVISGDESYMQAALKAADILAQKLVAGDGAMLHNYKNGKASINGFLEDYALFADAAIELYQATLDEKWIYLAKQLTDYTLQNFYDSDAELFWFTDANDAKLVSRKKEIYDNVIPSSNSVMGHVLFKLSKFFEEGNYFDVAKKMAVKMIPYVKKHPSSFSNWAKLIFYLTGNFYEIVVTGPDAEKMLAELYVHSYSLKILGGAVSSSELPLFKNRFKEGKSIIYICSGNVCKKPVESIKDALEQLS